MNQFVIGVANPFSSLSSLGGHYVDRRIYIGDRGRFAKDQIRFDSRLKARCQRKQATVGVCVNRTTARTHWSEETGTDRSKLVLVGVNGLNDLSVDEVSGYIIQLDVMPRGEDLLAVVQLPRCVLLTTAFIAYDQLTLGDGIHHVIRTLTQRRHLHTTLGQ